MKNKYEVCGNSVIIFLNRKHGTSMQTEIDIGHLRKAQSFPNTWMARWNQSSKTYYVFGNIYLGKRKNGSSKLKLIFLHRWLLEPSDDMVIDHKDHNGLNNRESINLRIITHGQNLQNYNGARKDNKSSGIRGVSWNEKLGKWNARFQVNGKREYLGMFETPEEAEIAVRNARAKYMPFSKEINEIELNEDENYLRNRDAPKFENTKSGVRNVYWNVRNKKWAVIVHKDKKQYYYGLYENIEKAEEVAKKARKEHYPQAM